MFGRPSFWLCCVLRQKQNFSLSAKRYPFQMFLCFCRKLFYLDLDSYDDLEKSLQVCVTECPDRMLERYVCHSVSG